MRSKIQAAILAVTLLMPSTPAAQAQPSPRPVGEAVSVGTTNRLVFLAAEAARLRPKLRQMMEALSTCTLNAADADAKAACVTRTQAVADAYFDAELALLQGRADGHERDLQETRQMIKRAQARGDVERAAIERRVVDDLLPSLTKGYAELQTRLDTARVADKKDERYIQSLSISLDEYRAALEALKDMPAKMDRLDFKQDEAIHSLNQFCLFLEARLRYSRAHKETYEIERELTNRALFARLSVLRVESISDRAKERGTRAPDIETWLSDGDKLAETPALTPRFSTVAACRKANPHLSELACLPLIVSPR
jgi:hypothetical protein